MFNFFKNKKNRDQELVNQVVGGQSVLFRMFREVFDENSDEVSIFSIGQNSKKGNSIRKLLTSQFDLTRVF